MMIYAFLRFPLPLLTQDIFRRYAMCLPFFSTKFKIYRYQGNAISSMAQNCCENMLKNGNL